MNKEQEMMKGEGKKVFIDNKLIYMTMRLRHSQPDKVVAYYQLQSGFSGKSLSSFTIAQDDDIRRQYRRRWSV